jgi:putative transposase
MNLCAEEKEAESGRPVKEIGRKYGISSGCYDNWNLKFGGLSVSELKRARDLVAENAKLKRMYADLALENHALSTAAVGWATTGTTSGCTVCIAF